MKWTKTSPTAEGFYWTRAKRREDAPFPPTPEVVLVMHNAEAWVYFGTGIGNEGCVDEMELWGEEPLRPPDEGTEVVGDVPTAKRIPDEIEQVYQSGLDPARTPVVFPSHFFCWKCNREFPADGNVNDGVMTCPGCGATKSIGDGRVRLPSHVDQEPELLCKPCPPDVLKKAREEGARQAAAQAGGGFRCPKCKTVFLDTGFPRLPGERGDGGSSGWRVTCPGCKHEWNCLNFLPSVEDRLADLEKDVRQLRAQETSREADEKRAVEKRCGTCAFGQGDLCVKVRFVTVKPAGMPNASHHGVSAELIVGDLNGPPWSDCRFWKPCEEKKQ